MRGATRSPPSRRCTPRNFNPRAPCGARHKSVVIVNSAMIFQSTRPVRGATLLFLRLKLRRIHFNPRAPCGARPRRGTTTNSTTLFQSTRPVRGATTRKDILRHEWEFQSTRPVRGATMGQAAREADGWISIHAPRAGRDIYLVPQVGVLFVISIHAPRAGRDQERQARDRGASHFNPRAPCGARPPSASSMV